jgi:RimJ/RimL family protein N-acetyltransferase/ribosomal protein S18 acetylase RimI-like enzyme
MPRIEFRRFGPDDFEQVFLWLLRPHVVRGYAVAPNSFMEMVAKFGPRTRDDNVVKAYLFSIEGRDAGYIQKYDVAAFEDYAALVGEGAGTACIDFFIGEEADTGRGFGGRIIERFVKEIVFADPGVKACIAGPGEGNKASIRALEKAGFRRSRIVRIKDGEQSECIMRRDRDMDGLRLAPIDLARDAGTCIDFRRDSFFESFGTHEGCDAEMGADGAIYLEKLGRRMSVVPEGNSHLWHGDRIIGQTEMRLADQPGLGYVNLFYLVPEWRKHGLGRLLHEHAVAVFTARGLTGMRLSVSRTNDNALRFYRRLGWKRMGFRPNNETVDLMEFAL